MREVLIAFISAGGVLTAREAGMGIYKWLTGRQKAERTAIQDAWAERDREAARRREVEEDAHALRVTLIQHNIEVPKALRADSPEQ